MYPQYSEQLSRDRYRELLRETEQSRRIYQAQQAGHDQFYRRPVHLLGSLLVQTGHRLERVGIARVTPSCSSTLSRQ